MGISSRHEGTGLAESGKRSGNGISQATRDPSQASGKSPQCIAIRIWRPYGWLRFCCTAAGAMLSQLPRALRFPISSTAVSRARDCADGFGRWLDSLADAVFVLTALTCEARVMACASGKVDWW
jgi:hypothetical protein